MTYYKVLNNGKGPYSGYDYTEYLPKDGKPGKWLPKVDKLELCVSGYHVTDAKHLIEWIDGNQLFEVAVKGEKLKSDDKTACQQIRLVRQIDGWNDKNLRLFACWCVEISNLRKRISKGLATDEELAAALAAARDAAWAVVRAAALCTTGAAAGGVTWDAAWAAAWAAAWDAARGAQSIKLQEMVLGYTA